MAKITKDTALSRITTRINEINKNKFRSLTFLGFENNTWLGKNTKIIIRCNIHNTITHTSYRVFMLWDRDWGCDKCRVDSIKRSKSICQNEDQTLELIQSKVSEINQSGKNIEFLGFVGEFCTNASNLKLNIRCITHNELNYPTLQYFIKNGCKCKYCIGEENSNSHKKSNQEIYNNLSNRFPGYDFSSILREPEYGSDVHRIIVFYCPVHGKLELSLSRFKYITDSCPCAECRKNLRNIDNENNYRVNIQNSINQRNSSGYDLKFIDFENGKYEGCYTKLILHCNIHNVTWNTTTYRNFISGNSICGCPICSANIHPNEQKCFSILETHKETVLRQYEIKYYDEKLMKDRSFLVDYYLPDRMAIIEYDGIQHYEYVEFYYHRDYEKYNEQVRRDNNLMSYCATHGIKLLRIPYIDNNRLEEIILEFLNTGRDITTPITPKTYG